MAGVTWYWLIVVVLGIALLFWMRGIEKKQAELARNLDILRVDVEAHHSGLQSVAGNLGEWQGWTGREISRLADTVAELEGAAGLDDQSRANGHA